MSPFPKQVAEHRDNKQIDEIRKHASHDRNQKIRFDRVSITFRQSGHICHYVRSSPIPNPQTAAMNAAS